MKKFLFIVLVLSGFSCSQFQSEDADLVSLIPYSASVILKVNQAEKLIDLAEQNLFVSNLLKSPYGQGTEEFFSQINLLPLNILEPFWITSNLSGVNKVSWMFMQEGPSQKHTNLISQLSQSGASRLYEGVHIFTQQAGESNFFIAQYNEILFVSTDDIMLEESIRQRKLETELNASVTLNNLLASANHKDPFNLFINPSHAADWFKQFLPIDWNAICGSTGWLSLDAGFPRNSLVLNGISLVQDSLGHSLAWFKGNAAQKLKIFQAIPNGASSALAFGMGNALQWHRSYEKWLKQQLTFDQYQEHLSDYGTPGNVVDAFISWIDTECAIFTTELRTKEAQNQVFALFKARNAKDAINQLRPFGESQENYRDLPIFRLKFKNITGTVWGKPFDKLTRPYYSYLGGYLIFANDLTGLKSAINDWYLGNTLANQEQFNEFIGNFDGHSHVLGFAQNPSFQSWMRYWTNDEIVDSNFTNAFDRAAIQMRVEGDIAYTTLLFEKPPKAASQARVSWSLALDTAIIGSLHELKNHTNQSTELLAQDAANNIYLISSKGKILWKQPVDGPILGKVQQLDFYKNRKLQMMFNTKNKVYLLDRNGVTVENYPINLKKPASAGLAVFDYDQVRNYRIVIPCGRFMEYWSKEAKPIKGWGFGGSTDTISYTPKHVKAFGKDYILVRSIKNELYILSRTGQIRIPITQKLKLSNNPIYLQKGASLSQSRLISTDVNGAQIIIYLDGTIDRLEAEALSPSHTYLQDGNYAVVLNNDELRIEGNGYVNRYELEEGKHSNLCLLRLTDEAFISVMNKVDQKVYLLNSSAELLKGFPVFGERASLLCDIDADGHPNVVVAGTDGTIYNYSVD